MRGQAAEAVPVVAPVQYLPLSREQAVKINSIAVPIQYRGPAALPFQARLTRSDADRALLCLTQAIYYEAASEGVAGQRAVAQVILNRVRNPAFPGNVCGVVFQGFERRTGCQFTFTCDGSLARIPSRTGWLAASRVAASALAGDVFVPVGNATHYHTYWVHPYWAASLTRVNRIGAHIFYRWSGFWGTPNAFRQRYRGSEQLPKMQHVRASTLSGMVASGGIPADLLNPNDLFSDAVTGGGAEKENGGLFKPPAATALLSDEQRGSLVVNSVTPALKADTEAGTLMIDAGTPKLKQAAHKRAE